jgi:hypothetical protein
MSMATRMTTKELLNSRERNQQKIQRDAIEIKRKRGALKRVRNLNYFCAATNKTTRGSCLAKGKHGLPDRDLRKGEGTKKRPWELPALMSWTPLPRASLQEQTSTCRHALLTRARVK